MGSRRLFDARVLTASAAVLAAGACAPALSGRGDDGLRFEPYPIQAGGVVVAVERRPRPSSGTSSGTSTSTSTSTRETRLGLGIEEERIEVPAGRCAVNVALPERRTVTVGVFGPHEALHAFEVVGHGKLRALHSDDAADGMPRFVSFRTGAEPEPLTVVIDATAPVTLLRVAAEPFERPASIERDARAAPPPQRSPLPLVGLALPLGARAGYDVVEARYGFVRADVAEALRSAFRATKRRFGRNRIWIGDASQWNGARPATDRGRPRHISHHGGRDVDFGLPARNGASRLERRCDVVLVDTDRASCAPGTVRGFDAERLAYLLAQLIDGPEGHDAPGPRGPLAPLEVVLTDQAYVDALRAALPELRKKQWISEEAYGALGEEGLVRASPWHTDHVHVRFSGEPAVVPAPLNFEVTPRAAPEQASDAAGPHPD